MKNIIKTTQVAVVTLLIGLSAPVYGDYLSSYPYSSCYESNDCSSCGAAKGFIKGEALYLTATEGGLSSGCDFSQTTDMIIDNRLITTIRGKGEDPHFDWNWGYRAGAGFDFTNWDLAAYWTHFKTKSQGHNYNTNNNRWNIQLNYIDVLLGYKFNVSNCVVLRPYGGVRGTRIQQHLHSHFLSTTQAGSTFTTTNFLNHNQEKFTGVGPLVGLEGIWNLGCGFGLYACGDVGVLYGEIKTKFDESEVFDTGSSFTRLSNHQRIPQYFAEAGFGIRWRSSFCGCMQLILQLGLEHHSFFNQNHLCSYGDLSLDGGNFSATLEF